MRNRIPLAFAVIVGACLLSSLEVRGQGCVCDPKIKPDNYFGVPLFPSVMTGDFLLTGCKSEQVLDLQQALLTAYNTDNKIKPNNKFPTVGNVTADFARGNCRLPKETVDKLVSDSVDQAQRNQKMSFCQRPETCDLYQRAGACFLFATGVPPQKA